MRLDEIVAGATVVGLAGSAPVEIVSIAEKNRWTQDAITFNAVATSWPEIVAASRDDSAAPTDNQSTFDFEE